MFRKRHVRKRLAVTTRLTPGQARIVASWRLDDARFLWKSGGLKHLNGAVYLAGLVLDCLLKARLLEKFPSLRQANIAALNNRDRRRWDLIYRGHDLEGLIVELPEVVEMLQENSPFGTERLDNVLKVACSSWSIHVRYLPKRIDRGYATEFLEQVEELKKWL